MSNDNRIDYSFMQIGGLHQDAVDVMHELCRRFGPDKAMSVYSETIDRYRSGQPSVNADNLSLRIINECGIEPSDDDIRFLIHVAWAVGNIDEARRLMGGAIRGFKKTTDQSGV